MSDETTSLLDEVIADYLRAKENGQPVDREQLFAEYPALAAELKQFFEDRDGLSGMAPPMSRPPLATIRYFGDYELLEEIACGGMGIVYKARQQSLNRTVAVKTILAGKLATRDDEKRFQAEAEAAAGLEHEAIVPIFEVGRHDGQHFFSMRYVEGRSLAELVRENPLPARRAAEYVKQAAEAIHYAHQQGTLHRDLKPSNILVGADDRIQVTDFGLAMRVEAESDLTRTGQGLGTPSYMAPEQAQGKRGLVGPASDVYSLGVVLYELMVGRPPFRAETAVETLRQVIETEPASPRLLNPKVPRDLETICLKCLQKAPHRRYDTAGLLGEDLGRYLQGRPIVARPVGRVERSWRWYRRNTAVAGLLAAVALCLIVGTGVASYFAVEAGNRVDDALWAQAQAEQARGDSEQRRQEAEATTILAEQRQKESEENAKLAQQHLYVADMNLVQNAWEHGKFGHVLNLLERHRPGPNEEDLRGFEWYYWHERHRRSHRPRLTLEGHGKNVTSVAFSTNGKRIVTGSSDMTAKVWDVVTGGETLTLKGHTDYVFCVAFSPDGTWIVTGSRDNTAKIWDALTGEVIFTLKGHTGAVTGVGFSPHGGRIVTGSTDNTAKIWDALTGEEILTRNGHRGRIFSVAFGPRGSRIVTGGRSTLKIRDAFTGQEILTLKGHVHLVDGVVFSQDGSRILSASQDGTAKIWDAVSGEEIRTVQTQRLYSGCATDIALSSDGMRIATTSPDGTAKIWDVDNKRVLTKKGHGRSLTSVTFSPDGERILSTSDDGTAKIWEVATGDEIQTLNAARSSAGYIIRSSAAFSSDGRRIIIGGYGATLVLWKAATGEEIQTLKGIPQSVQDVAFSPDDTRIVAGGRDPAIWDAATGEKVLTFEGHTGSVKSVAFSPDGSRILTGSYDTTAKLWHAAIGQEILTLGRRPPGVHLMGDGTPAIASVAFSPDGSRIVTGHSHSMMKLWEAPRLPVRH